MGLKRIIADIFSRDLVNREPPALWVALCLVPDHDKLMMLGVYTTRGTTDHSWEQFVDMAMTVAYSMGLKKSYKYDLQFFDWNHNGSAMIAVRSWLVGYGVPAEDAVEFARSVENDLLKSD